WTQTIPAGTSIAMSYRLCSSSCATEAWISISNGTNINQSANYIQYRATLTTSDTTVTPSLDSVNIEVSYTPMTIKARSCDDPLCAGESWTTVDTDITAGTETRSGLSLASLSVNRYIQYQVDLATVSNSESPTLNDIQINYETNTAYDFTLSANPASYSVVQNNSTSVTVNVNVSSFSPGNAVNFTYSVSPTAGAPTASFSPSASCNPTTSGCSVAMNISNTAMVGDYTITIAGTNGDLWRTTTFALNVAPPISYSLSLSSSGGEVVKGNVNSVTTVLSVQYNSGAGEFVSITDNAPSGVSFDPSPTGCSPKDFSPGPCSITITMQADATVAPGSYAISINGLSDQSGTTASPVMTYNLTVSNPISYTVSASPASGAVFQGGSMSMTMTATYQSGAAEDVSFTSFNSASNPSAFNPVPAAGTISVSFTPSVTSCALSSTQTSCAKTVSIGASSSATPGVYVITISGLSSITNTPASTTFTLTVSGPFDFALALGSPVSPCALNNECSMEQSGQITIPVVITSASLIGLPVTLSVGGLPATDVGATIPSPCTPSSTVTCNNSVIISTGVNAPLGVYLLTITATGGTNPVRQYSLAYKLTITQGFTFDISLSPTSGKAIRGGASVSVLADLIVLTGTGKDTTITVLEFIRADDTKSSDFSSIGVTYSFPNGSVCVPDCQKQIIFSAASTAEKGVYRVVIIAEYGGSNPSKEFILTIDDPFNFTLGNLSASGGSIMQGDPLSILTVATSTWAAGGPDDVQFSAAHSVAGLTVDFSPTACLQMSQTNNNPCATEISFAADNSVDSKTYPITIIASSGPTIRSKTFYLAVGTAFDFDLDMLPVSLRLQQSEISNSTASSSLKIQATVTATTTAELLQINFSVGDRTDYKLPAGVEILDAFLAPVGPNAVFASCSPANTVGDTSCSPNVNFAISPTAPNGTYIIPIMGTDSTEVKQVMTYLNLKVGALTLTEYKKDFRTDPHQRPQISVAWYPFAPFAGQEVNFTPTVYVYSDSQTTLTADTVVDAGNKDTLTSAFNWSFDLDGVPPADQNSNTFFTSLTYPNSSPKNSPFGFSLTVADATGDVCGASGADPCSCVYQTAFGSGIIVSKPAPNFKEVKP
ncbi:MAG TPA: hypothetical protein VJK01_02760, partial [Candidatus Paceibacterota bacterium]